MSSLLAIVRIEEAVATSARPAALPAGLQARFGDDERSELPLKRTMPALVAAIEAESPALIATTTPFSIARHQCEFADQWVFFQLPTIYEPCRENLILEYKPFISGAGIADFFLAYIPDERNELLVFLVARNDPGVEIEFKDVFGFRSGGICGLKLTNVHIPFDRIIVKKDGLSHGQRYLNTRRVFLSCGFLGRMRAILERCILMVGSTQRHGKCLLEFQNVQAAIGQMTILYETARSCIYRSLEHMVAGRANQSFDAVYSIAKYVVADHGREMINIAMHLVGGKGYLEANRYSRDLADFCALISGAGTQDILEINIGMLKANETMIRNRHHV